MTNRNLADRRIGPYQMLGLLGKGGMGEVYRAHDTKLGREVAIKVLPPDVTSDPDRLARFEREARVLASLNHPHIGAIYGFEETEGIRALVLELVEGATLGDRLAAGPLAIEEALGVARDIAQALEAAHEKGIVHRDLKPANIKITPAGTVKVLDFGLAKFADAVGPDVASSATPTLDHTRDGLILGTAAYMSPEQARGKPVDKRTDIWAFGCVLYQMLTGRTAHDGETFSDVLVAILEREPDWSGLPDATPPGVRRLLRRCLEKDRTRRLHDIADARIELEEALASHRASSITEVEPPLPRAWTIRRPRLVLLGLALLLVGSAIGIGATVFTIGARAPEDVIETRFQVLPPTGASFEGSLAVSPDGRWIAFTALSAGQSRLWLRARKAVTARAVEGSAGAHQPFWSPDSRALAFFAAGKLKRVTVPDGIPQSIADAHNPSGGSWNRDDVVLFAPFKEMPLQRVPATGGKATPVRIAPASGQPVVPDSPHFLPDGRHFLFYGRSPVPARSGVYVGSIDTSDAQLLVATTPTRAEYTGGYVLFMREGALVAQPFDAKALAFAGKPTQAAERIAYDEANGASFSASPSGVLAYWAVSRRNGQIVLFGRAGNRLAAFGQPGEYSGIALSPDQRELAVEHLGEEQHTLWLIDWERQLPRRFAGYTWSIHHPIWSPEGTSVVYTGNPGQGYNLFRKSIASDAPDERLVTSPGISRPTDWGVRALVYEQVGTETGWDVWYLTLPNSRTPVPFLRTQFNEVQGHLSPNGRWLAYTSDESSTSEVYVQAFPSGGDKVRVSNSGGSQPKWRADGKELFYLSADRQLMAVNVRSQSPLVLGTPRALFFTGIAGPVAIAAASNNHYAVSADGQRFYVNTSVEQLNIAPVTVVLNWAAGLRR